MEREHNDLQLHIARTDWWCENLGMWKAFIVSGEVWGFLWLFIFWVNSNLLEEKNKNLYVVSLYLGYTVYTSYLPGDGEGTGTHDTLASSELLLCFPSGYYDAYTKFLVLRHCCNGGIKVLVCM